MIEKIENSNSYNTIRLNKKSLVGPDNLLLSKRQFNKIQKSLNNGTGTDLKFKKNQILYDRIQHEEIKGNGTEIIIGGFLGTLANLGCIILPFVSKFAPKVLAPLASGAVNALGSLGIEKLISGKGLLQDLQKYNEKQNFTKEEIINDIHKLIKFLEENKEFKITKKQQGGFLGALAAAFGIPLLVKLFGGNIQEGQGILSNFLKMIGHGLDLERTNQNLIDFFHHILLVMLVAEKDGKIRYLKIIFIQFIQIIKKKFLLNFRILSNIDLLIISEDLGLDLGIIDKKYDGVFSRDNIPNQNEMYIINLDSKIGPGTHWVSVIIESNRSLYFDSFGLIPPYELINLRSEYYYNFLQYQPIKSFLCGYYCLYFLNEFNKLSSITDRKNSSSIKKFNRIIEPF